MESSVIRNHDRITTLLKKEAERHLELQKKKNEKKFNPEHEQYNYFAQIFQEKIKDIEIWLDQAPNIDQTEIAFHFDKISHGIHLLQKFVAESLLFLRGYNIRICQESLQEIETKARKLEDQLIPKKKFGFKNKGVAKKLEAVTTKQNGHDEVDNRKKNIYFAEIFFGFKNQKNTLFALPRNSLLDKDVTLQNLENCVIQLNGALSTLHMNSLTNCVVLSGPVTTSIFAENCKNCKLVFACQQLRLHSSFYCDIYLHVTSKAIIEDCNNIKVTPYNYVYNSLQEDFFQANLDINVNHWDNIDDFNWLVADKHSPNWALLEDSQKILNWDDYTTKLNL